MVSTFDGVRANLMTKGFNMPIAHGSLIGLILDLRDRMTKWQYLTRD